MKAIKDKKDIHNRFFYNEFRNGSTKERRKEKRQLMKQLRHKLLFNIPLDESEQKIVNETGLTEHTAIDKNGNINSNRYYIDNGDGTGKYVGFNEYYNKNV